jgi:glycogen(starch) synthase
MKILFWSELFWPYLGGVEMLALTLLTGMRHRGFEFVVVTSHGDLELPDEDEYAGIRICRLPFRAALEKRDLPRLLETRHRVTDLKRRFVPDVVHLFAIGGSALVHLQTIRSSPAPTLVTLHGEVLRKGAGGPDSILQKALLTADHIVAVSAAVADGARQLTPALTSPVSVIYTGLKAPSRGSPALAADEVRLLCLGRLIPDKGFDVAIRAFARIANRFPLARLIIAGDGPEQASLRALATTLNVEQLVDFIGWVSPDDVPELIGAATLVLMPSRREGLPLTAIEAGQMARPVVATRVGGLAEVIVANETGLLVPVDDVELLANACASLLESPERTAQIGNAARERTTKIFSLDRYLDAYADLYAALVRNGRSAPLLQIP